MIVTVAISFFAFIFMWFSHIRWSISTFTERKQNTDDLHKIDVFFVLVKFRHCVSIAEKCVVRNITLNSTW